MAELDYQPREEIIEHPVRDPRQGFDLRTHIKNAKTGELIRVQAYDLHIVNGVKYFERPMKSGNLFFESGEHAGRWVKGEHGRYEVKAEAEHVAYLSPKTEFRTAHDIEDENDMLREELAALKAEKSGKMDSQVEHKKSSK